MNRNHERCSKHANQRKQRSPSPPESPSEPDSPRSTTPESDSPRSATQSPSEPGSPQPERYDSEDKEDDYQAAYFSIPMRCRFDNFDILLLRKFENTRRVDFATLRAF